MRFRRQLIGLYGVLTRLLTRHTQKYPFITIGARVNILGSAVPKSTISYATGSGNPLDTKHDGCRILHDGTDSFDDPEDETFGYSTYCQT